MILRSDVEAIKEEFLEASDREPERTLDLLCTALLFERQSFQSYGFTRSGHGTRNAYRHLLPPKPIAPSIEDPQPDEPI